MEKFQENKMSMYLSVQKVTNFHSDAWQDLPAFKNQFTEFESLIEKIRETRLVQEGMITGVTKDKLDAQNKAIEKGIEVATAVSAYASVSGNNKLKDRVAYSPSRLSRSRDTIIIDSLNVIKAAANQNISKLSDYGLTQEDIDELTVLTDLYISVVENPRQAITNRSRSTKELRDYIAKTDTVLKEQLDKLIYQFRIKSSVFFMQYKSARLIVDHGMRKKAKETDPEQSANEQSYEVQVA